MQLVRPTDVNLFQRELARLELRLDVLDEMQIRLFRLGVVRVAGHGDVAAGGFLVERGVEFAPVEQPAFEVGGGLALRGARFQLVEQRRDLRPVAEVNGWRDKCARLVARAIFRTATNSSGRINDLRFTIYEFFLTGAA